jgi:hypothetical protein
VENCREEQIKDKENKKSRKRLKGKKIFKTAIRRKR